MAAWLDRQSALFEASELKADTDFARCLGEAADMLRPADTSRDVKLTLPFPPSVNNYLQHRSVKRKATGRWTIIRYLSRVGNDFRSSVAEHIYEQLGRPPKLSGRLAIIVDQYPGPKTETGRQPGSAQDIDNSVKPLFDALQTARCFLNDSQIDQMLVRRQRRAAVGRVDVTIKPIGE